jgi:hypothetical protein
MRKAITPISNPFGPAAHFFECDDHRVVDGNVSSQVAYYSEQQVFISTKRVLLTGPQYSAWTEANVGNDDLQYLFDCHATNEGVTVLPDPEPEQPPAEDVPEQ